MLYLCRSVSPASNLSLSFNAYVVLPQFRDLLIANNTYAVDIKENLIPGSDLSGEIIAIGEAVQGWKLGDRVCANFGIDHIYGDPTPEIKKSHLGAPIDGVLMEYKLLPAHVCFLSRIHTTAHYDY